MQFNEDQLKDAVREFAFDVQHFRCYVKMHRSGMLNGHPSVAQAVRYSLLLHLRVVLDFFYGPTRQDGVGVGHFRKTFPAFGTRFRKIKVPKPADAERIRMNLHKRLAHLTSTRWEVRAPAMNYYDSYFDDTDALLIAFKDALPSDVQQVFLKGLLDWDSKHPAAI